MRAIALALYFVPFTAPALQTDPGVRCSLAASYLFIVETSPLLAPKVADASRRVSWT